MTQQEAIAAINFGLTLGNTIMLYMLIFIGYGSSE